MAQRHLADPMAGVHQIAATGVMGAGHLARRLDLRGRDNNPRQRLGQQQPGQQLGVLAIGLDGSDGPRGVLPGATTCIAIPTALAAR